MLVNPRILERSMVRTRLHISGVTQSFSPTDVQVAWPENFALASQIARDRDLTEIILTAISGEYGTETQFTQQEFLTSYRGKTPVYSPIETGVHLDGQPTVLPDDLIRHKLYALSIELDEPVMQFPVVTRYGRKWIQQPTVTTFEVDTTVEVEPGQTFFLGGFFSTIETPDFTTRFDASVVATAEIIEESLVQTIAMIGQSSTTTPTTTPYETLFANASISWLNEAVSHREQPAIADGKEPYRSLGSITVPLAASVGTTKLREHAHRGLPAKSRHFDTDLFFEQQGQSRRSREPESSDLPGSSGESANLWRAN